MAAQTIPWATFVGREDTLVGRRRMRREPGSPDWESDRDRYHQPPASRRDLSAGLLVEGAVESKFSHATAILDLDERLAGAEIVEADPLPRIRLAIDKLMSPNEDDGDPAATEHAYQSARAVVESAYGRLFAGIDAQARRSPRHRIEAFAALNRTRIPIVTTDEHGGIRLSWQHEGRHVRANFAAAEGLRSYMYFESPLEHDVEALQPDTLSNRLDWMLKP